MLLLCARSAATAHRPYAPAIASNQPDSACPSSLSHALAWPGHASHCPSTWYAGLWGLNLTPGFCVCSAATAYQPAASAPASGQPHSTCHSSVSHACARPSHAIYADCWPITCARVRARTSANSSARASSSAGAFCTCRDGPCPAQHAATCPAQPATPCFTQRTSDVSYR